MQQSVIDDLCNKNSVLKMNRVVSTSFSLIQNTSARRVNQRLFAPNRVGSLRLGQIGGIQCRTAVNIPGILDARNDRNKKSQVDQTSAIRFQLSHVLNQRRYLSATSKPSTPSEKDELSDEQVAKLGTIDKVRVLWKKYGIVFIGLYGTIYLMTLGTVYEVVAMKHIDAAGAVAYLHSLGVDKFVDLSPISNSKAGNFALAWILTKFTEPLRLAFTLSITPYISKFVKPAPPKAEEDKVA